MVFVNKLDRERSSFDRTLDEHPRPVRRRRRAARAAHRRGGRVPRRRRPAHRHRVPLRRRTGGHRTAAIPDDMEALEHQVHDNLVEGIVVADDELLEGYLDGEVPSVDELERTLAHGVDPATVFPVVCGSATGRIAIDRLADFICEIGPSPLDRPPAVVEAGGDAGRDRAGRRRPAARRSCSRRWPTRSSGRSRCSGCCRARSAPTTTSSTPAPAPTSACTACSVRPRARARRRRSVAGDIGAVAKLSGTATGDTLAPKGTPVRVPPPDAPRAGARHRRSCARTDRRRGQAGRRPAPARQRGPRPAW